MKIITFNDINYPVNLREITGAPKHLYIKGSLIKNDSFAIAIVGSRNMSKYGEKTADYFASELAKNGVTIVSGLARGIDTVAHKAALKAGGRTLAVLGSGFDNLYPPENEELANLIKRSGAVMSEFEPAMKPLAKNFLIRNRIISGLSHAVIIVEGTKRSGTLSTATHAANQGREVFAVPGPIDSPLSELPNYLLEQGAQIAKNPNDILDFLNSTT